ncbi:MAG: nitroreductase family protein [Halobacteria archaeon]
MDLGELARTRRSLHSYTDDELTKDAIMGLFETVRTAPSSFNLQPWEFLTVRSESGKERLKDCAYGQQHVTDASAVVVVLGHLNRSSFAERTLEDQVEKGYRSRENADELLDMFEHEELQDNVEWTVQSCTIAATYLMLAAWNNGIASCPMAGFDPRSVENEFDVPENLHPVLMVTLGYPDLSSREWNRERKWRRDVEDMVNFEELSFS